MTTTTKTLLSPFLLGVCVVGGLLSACEPSEPVPRGRELYDSCLPCHNEQGQGNQAVLAPAIAGLPQWYIEDQLMKFRAATRGYHFDDLAGLRMRPMALSMPTLVDVQHVAAYVASMPRQAYPKMLPGGDAARGQALFAPCIACHGADGTGNRALNAPPLVGANDWYLFEQLKKYQTKMRGDPAIDPVGGTMQAMSATLPDEQAMKDVIAYIMTLPVPASVQPVAPPAPSTPPPAPASQH